MRCEFCGPGPCRFPAFCEGVEKANERWHDRTAGGELPWKWWEMNETQLGRWIDAKHEKRRLARIAQKIMAKEGKDAET